MKKFLMATGFIFSSLAILTMVKTVPVVSKETVEIKVGTFNTHNMKDSVEDISNYIHSRDFDIIGFQEVNFIDEYNNIKKNGSEYLKNYPAGLMVYPCYGNMIYSNKRVVSSKMFSLPISIKDETRILSKDIFNIKDKNVSVYVTHLSALDNDVNRKKQLQYILDIMNEDENPYKILLGDLNIMWESELNNFKEDGYKLCNGINDKWYNTYKNEDKSRIGSCAIDNIIVSESINIEKVGMDEDNLSKSDHKLFYATLTF